MFLLGCVIAIINAHDLSVIDALKRELEDAVAANEAYFAVNTPLDLDSVRHHDVLSSPKRPSPECKADDGCYPESCLEYQYLHYWEDGYYVVDPDQDGSSLDVKCAFDYSSTDFHKSKAITELYFNHYTEEYSTYVGGVWQCPNPPCEKDLFAVEEMHARYHLSEGETRKVVKHMDYCEQQIDAECSYANAMVDAILWFDMFGNSHTYFHGNDPDYAGCQCGLDNRKRLRRPTAFDHKTP